MLNDSHRARHRYPFVANSGSRPVKRWAVLWFLGMLLVAGCVVSVTRTSAAASCGMQKGGPVAFCDTFDAPANKPGRSGDLDETIWGVSRVSDENFGQGIKNAVAKIASPCGGAPEAWPVRICNGQMVTTVDDHEGVANLATYPKQPFDFAGRTGTVSFDVSNDTQGNHMAWPEFWITTKPTPAPMDFFSDHYTTPEFGLGIQFDNTCGDAGIIDTVANYNITAASRTRENCIGMSNGTTMNHYEIRISQTQVEVWGSDAGSTTLKRLNVATVNLQFTRGLVWLDQVHYNACKTPGTQCRHSFRWDNLAFDGPYTYNDLTYDVLDNTEVRSDGRVNLGWTNPGDLTTLPIPSQSVIDTASGAFLLFSNYTWTEPTTFTFTVNGHQWATPNPFAGGSGFGRHTLYFPVDKSFIVPGPNVVRIAANQTETVSNVNILLVAAVHSGGGAPPPATNTPTPATPTATKSPSVTVSPTSTALAATATSKPSSTPTGTATSKSSATPTATATSKPPATPTATTTQPPRSGGWSTSATPSAPSVSRGSQLMVMTYVTAPTPASALVDVEVFDAAGNRVVQQFVDQQAFQAESTRSFGLVYTVPTNAVRGTWTVKVGVFAPNWGSLTAWNNSAATFQVN